MRNWLIFFIAAVALTACTRNSAVTRQFERYRTLATEPTPSDWKPGAIWIFVTTDGLGRKETLTFRVLDTAAETCTSGDWRALDLIDGKMGSLPSMPSKPAALVEGRNLLISLTANWCDINNGLRGELQGNSFICQRTSGGMTGTTLIGQVQGRRVK
jgi:hypothetical protein